MLNNNVVAALLLPPASLALAALLALALLRGRLGRALAVAGLLGLVLLSLPVVSMALLASLDPLAEAPATSVAPEAIVVLGGDVFLIPDPPGVVLGGLSLERVRAGASLQRQSGLPVLVTGGVVDSQLLSIGELMAESMIGDFGVPVRWTEAESRTTWENAEFSARILASSEVRRVYVVTHAWHMRRSLLAFRHFGMMAVPAPVRRDPWPTFQLWEFLPRTSAWVNSFYAMHEWVGLAYYSIRQWRST